MKPVLTPDIVVAGSGIIGLALALELHHRGASVAVFDTAAAASGASTAQPACWPPKTRTILRN